ncbi:NADP-dependent fatty aldehyde dehydrogenase [Candidatus Sulfotelmatobacter kueseliae]|uniref:NADP-dependent fatty aldehyde dehydrogenase n=1 Tax=Candidatus Sulfotelmatobacter kueseliae TaxID=2042962 RepID=A0A2U3KB33_9BACT|nr:NADP-dependent fatty aldehyde dehydrogenase [Candidatus Sulfotelmatobacter kueseliae]
MLASMAKLSGRSLIGFREGAGTAELLYATDPTTGQHLQPGFIPATGEEVELAARLAAEAFEVYRRAPGRERGAFLRKIAAKIESIAEEVVERAGQETALPRARLQGETARTCGQLRLFAQVAEEGSWVNARIDHADPGRKPLPKPDIRSMLRPLGPVVVFGASNFPLAFSVAGGDTASALAGGNTVIVKAHAAHPGTSELVGRAVQESVRECGLPEGVFSLLFGSGSQVGTALMKHPLVRAGGFTGSRTAGRTLMDVAASRPEPIPFYAEMSSTNPVFILPGALHQRAETIAAGLHASFTLGAGQFCTKPGMVFLPQGTDAELFTRKLRQLVTESSPFHLLTRSIHHSYDSAIAGRKTDSAVELVAQGLQTGATGFAANSALFETDASAFLGSDLDAEIFGPTTILVRHASRDQVLAIARSLEGHLTATVHGTDQDLHEFADLLAILETKVGRLVFNGFPTGVEVTHAMVHGGPYPATSDGRSTSVGSQAIFRFTRLVCYQGFPDTALPDELKDSNPLGLWRMLDGKMTDGQMSRDASAPASETRA